MRIIHAIFEIQAESNISGVRFESEGKTLNFEDMTRLEQIRMLNGWASAHKLFYKHVKEED